MLRITCFQLDVDSIPRSFTLGYIDVIPYTLPVYILIQPPFFKSKRVPPGGKMAKVEGERVP